MVPAAMGRLTCACLSILAGNLLIAIPTANAADDPPKAFVILACDTQASGIGIHVKQDLQNLTKIFNDAFVNRPDRLTLRIVTAAEMSPGGIVKILKDLGKTIRPKDTVLFYYSGHGAMDVEHGHVLKIQRMDLVRAKLAQQLQSLQAHNTILITDSCSDLQTLELTGPETKDLPVAGWPVLDGLLFQHEGFTDINSCQGGTFALCYFDDQKRARGGVFTLALARLICAKPSELSPGNEVVGWPDFIVNLSIKTNENFLSMKDHIKRARKDGVRVNDVNQDAQVPRVSSLATIKPRRLVDQRWYFGAHVAPRIGGGGMVAYIPDGVRAPTEAGSPAAILMIQEGDLIQTVNGVPVETKEDYTTALHNSGGQIELAIIRGGKPMTLPTILLPPRNPAAKVPLARP